MSHSESDPCEFFRTTIALLAKPWTGHILWTLQEGPLRFNELAAQVAGIGEKVLSARLKELEARNLLVRTVHPTTPVKVEYGLTAKGRGFQQVVDAVNRWGALISQPERPNT